MAYVPQMHVHHQAYVLYCPMSLACTLSWAAAASHAQQLHVSALSMAQPVPELVMPLVQLHELQDLMTSAHSHAETSSDGSSVYDDIGNSTLEEAHLLVAEHVKNCIGPAKVHRVCAALMRLYFGDRGQGAGDALAPNDDIMSVWNLDFGARRTCTFVSSKEWGSPWELPTYNEYGIRGVVPMEEIVGMSGTDFRKVLINYVGLFRHEMRKRGLHLTLDTPPSSSFPFSSDLRSQNVWRLHMEPVPDASCGLAA